MYFDVLPTNNTSKNPAIVAKIERDKQTML